MQANLVQVSDMMPIYAAIVSWALSGVVGLIGWGVKNEVKLLRAEMKGELATAELRFYEKVNGNYVKKEIATQLRQDFDNLEARVNGGIIDG